MGNVLSVLCEWEHFLSENIGGCKGGIVAQCMGSLDREGQTILAQRGAVLSSLELTDWCRLNSTASSSDESAVAQRSLGYTDSTVQTVTVSLERAVRRTELVGLERTVT